MSATIVAVFPLYPEITLSRRLQSHRTEYRIPTNSDITCNILKGTPIMSWTRQTPHKPGFYWVHEGDGDPQIVEVRSVPGPDRMFEVLLTGDLRRYPLGLWNHAQWLGPLEPGSDGSRQSMPPIQHERSEQ